MVIHEKARRITTRKITITIDSQEIFKMLKEMRTVNQHAQDGAAEVIKIKAIVKEMKFEVELQRRRGHGIIMAT